MPWRKLPNLLVDALRTHVHNRLLFLLGKGTGLGLQKASGGKHKTRGTWHCRKQKIHRLMCTWPNVLGKAKLALQISCLYLMALALLKTMWLMVQLLTSAAYKTLLCASVC